MTSIQQGFVGILGLHFYFVLLYATGSTKIGGGGNGIKADILNEAIFGGGGGGGNNWVTDKLEICGGGGGGGGGNIDCFMIIFYSLFYYFYYWIEGRYSNSF